MKNLLRCSVITTLICSASTAGAVGLYAFGQVGAVLQDNLPQLPGTQMTQIDKYGFHFGAGYDTPRDETMDIGARIGFGYYGQTIWSDANNNTIDSHSLYGLDLQAVGTYHASRTIDVLAHGGVVFMQDTVIHNYSGSTNNHTKPVLGVGAVWNYQPKLNIMFDYDHIFGSNVGASNFTDMPSVDAFWLGVRYRFNPGGEEQQ